VGDIFREIDEELRQERFERLWKRYGKFIVGAAVAVVLIVGGYKFWEYYSLKQKEKSSVQYWSGLQLLNDGKKEDAAALFGSLVKNGTSGYGVLAKFQRTAIFADRGDVLNAISMYDEISDDSNINEALRDAATINSVALGLDQKDAQKAVLEKKLEKILIKKGAWENSATELMGLISIKFGDIQMAQKHFKKISDDSTAPQSMRLRASQVLAVINR